MSSLTVFVVVLVLTCAVVARPKDARVNSKRTVNGCGTTEFWGSRGLISTPSFPSNYPDNSNCVYKVRSSDPSFEVKFYTCECYLEDQRSCRYDWIDIGNSRICGNSTNRNFKVYTQNGRVEINFRSDSSVTFKGCQIAYGIDPFNQELRNLCSYTQTSPTPAFNWTSPSYNTSTPASNWTSPSYNTSTPPFNWTSPSYNTSTPPFNWTSPSYNTSTPPFNWTSPSYNTSTPPFNWTSPSYNTSTPPFNWTSPSYNTSTPPFNWTSPSYNTSTPPFNWTSPSYNFTTRVPPYVTTPTSNSSVPALLSQLWFLEHRIESLFREYRNLVQEIYYLLN